LAVQGFQKYGGHVSGENKSACGNVVGPPGLPEIWASFFRKTNKKRLRQPSLPSVWGFQKYGGHFSGEKQRLRQRSWPFRTSRNVAVILLENKTNQKNSCSNVVGRSGLQKYGGHFSGENKAPAATYVAHSGLPEIWGSFFWRKEKAVAAT
jgi:hypothetical protein